MALELAGPGGETVDLKLAFSAEAVLPGATLEAYTMEPGARPEGPEGHAFDAAFTFLVVRLEEGARSLLGSFSVGADAGAPEYAVADYLRASGNEDAGRRLSFLRLLSDADAAVAPFLDRAEIEGAPVSDENGVVWRRLAGYEKQEGLPMEDQLLSQLRRVFAQDLAERLMQRSDGTFREWNDGLWIRSDAAERLGWDFTADLATLRFSGAYGWDTAVVDGTARGAPIEWHFRMSEDGDLRPYFIHYYSLCGEGWPSDAECAFLLGGAWYVLFQQGEPDLGAPLSSENWTGDSGYEGSRFRDRAGHPQLAGDRGRVHPSCSPRGVSGTGRSGAGEAERHPRPALLGTARGRDLCGVSAGERRGGADGQSVRIRLRRRNTERNSRRALCICIHIGPYCFNASGISWPAFWIPRRSQFPRA